MAHREKLVVLGKASGPGGWDIRVKAIRVLVTSLLVHPPIINGNHKLRQKTWPPKKNKKKPSSPVLKDLVLIFSIVPLLIREGVIAIIRAGITHNTLRFVTCTVGFGVLVLLVLLALVSAIIAIRVAAMAIRDFSDYLPFRVAYLTLPAVSLSSSSNPGIHAAMALVDTTLTTRIFHVPLCRIVIGFGSNSPSVVPLTAIASGAVRVSLVSLSVVAAAISSPASIAASIPAVTTVSTARGSVVAPALV